MIYNRGNDIAAEQYAAQVGEDEAAGDRIEALKCRRCEDVNWLAGAIDDIIAMDDLTQNGHTRLAADLADVLYDAANAEYVIRKLRRIVEAKAYEEAEQEVERERDAAIRDRWMGEDA